MQCQQSWHWFFFILASSCTTVAALLWPIAVAWDWRAWLIAVLLLFALLGMVWQALKPQTAALHTVSSTDAQRFLQQCLQLDEWKYSRPIVARVACRRTSDGKLVYVHPHVNRAVDLVILRQLVVLMCRYDCDGLRIYSYVGVTSAVRTASEQNLLEVIDHKQFSAESCP